MSRLMNNLLYILGLAGRLYQLYKLCVILSDNFLHHISDGGGSNKLI